MDWVPIIVLGFLLLFFFIFLGLWLNGAFTTPTYKAPSNNDQIQAGIDIVMPPSVWSGESSNGACMIYNYPIVNSTFPNVTNNADVVATLSSVPANRCYYSNELALQSVSRTCNANSCVDDLNNAYTNGQAWTYYQTCNNSCYADGQSLVIIVIAMAGAQSGNTTYGPQALYSTGIDAMYTGPPNLEDSRQYHVLTRYTNSDAQEATAAGHLCNFTNFLTGQYLIIAKVEESAYTYYVPTYTKEDPGKALWLLTPPTSLGGVAQSQKLVYIGDLTLTSNPSLYQYAQLAEQNSLLAIVYGENNLIQFPFVGIFMAPALNADQTFFSYNSQLLDLSRYSLMLSSSTSDFPFYRWSNSLVNY